MRRERSPLVSQTNNVRILDPTKSSGIRMPSSSSGALLGYLTSIFLGIAVPIIAIMIIPSATVATNTSAEFGTIIIIFLSGLRYGWVVGSKTQHLFEMIFWLFTYLFLGIAPLIQLRTGMFPGTTPNIALEYWPVSTAVVIVGCLALIAGSTVGKSTNKSQFTLKFAGVSEKRTITFSILMLCVSVYYILKIGLSNLFLSRFELISIKANVWSDSTVNAIIGGGTTMGLLVAFVGLIHLNHQRKKKQQRRPVLLTVTVFLALIICTNPISTTRFVFGTALLSVIAASGLFASILRYRIAAIFSIVGFVVLFPLADTFRSSSSANVKLESPLKSMTTGDFDAFGQIVNTVHLTVIEGYTHGQQILGVFGFWIPRRFWSDKPLDTGPLVAQFKGYSFENISSPLWAEFFIDGGWGWLVIAMFILGLLFRALDDRSAVALTSSPVPPVITCVVPFYLLIILRGSLLQAVAALSVILIAIWFIRPNKSISPSDRVM